jgi:hypothetical protein
MIAPFAIKGIKIDFTVIMERYGWIRVIRCVWDLTKGLKPM